MKKIIPILGLLLLAIGGVSSLIIGAIPTSMAVLMLIGLLSLLFFFYISLSDIRSILSKRSARYGANTALMIAVFVALIG